jgi:hypothetical protein
MAMMAVSAFVPVVAAAGHSHATLRAHEAALADHAGGDLPFVRNELTAQPHRIGLTNLPRIALGGRTADAIRAGADGHYEYQRCEIDCPHCRFLKFVNRALSTKACRWGAVGRAPQATSSVDGRLRTPCQSRFLTENAGVTVFKALFGGIGAGAPVRKYNSKTGISQVPHKT